MNRPQKIGFFFRHLNKMQKNVQFVPRRIRRKQNTEYKAIDKTKPLFPTAMLKQFPFS